MIKRWLNFKGMTIVEAMVGVSVLTIVGLSTAAVITNMAQAKKYIDIHRSAVLVNKQIVAKIQSEYSWERTIQGLGISCLVNDTDCSSHVNYPAGTSVALPEGVTVTDVSSNLSLYDERGNLFYNTAAGGSGFSLSGMPCDDFDRLNGNKRCPFRYNLQWRARCPSAGACINPQIEINGQFVYRWAQNEPQPPLNANQFSFTMLRPLKASTLANYCRSIGGSFDEATGRCRMGFQDRLCPAAGTPRTPATLGNWPSDQFFYGLDERGEPICQPLIGNCGLGGDLILTGFNPGGTPQLTCESRSRVCMPPAPTGDCDIQWYARPSGPTNDVILAPGMSRTFGPNIAFNYIGSNLIQRAAPSGGVEMSCPAGPPSPPAGPAVNCVGAWGACVGGVETYTITTPASGGGAVCAAANGATRTCSGCPAYRIAGLFWSPSGCDRPPMVGSVNIDDSFPDAVACNNALSNALAASPMSTSCTPAPSCQCGGGGPPPPACPDYSCQRIAGGAGTGYLPGLSGLEVYGCRLDPEPVGASPYGAATAPGGQVRVRLLCECDPMGPVGSCTPTCSPSAPRPHVREITGLLAPSC